MTGGQKAIAMLELIFRFDTNSYPIFLDQPEDDLDATGVANSVVDFIKSQKTKRQIFVVSHDGSLVVGADSEEVIVANNNGSFNYSVGAIEDKETRKSIVDILEGGKLRVYR
jgi:ABC-type enterochelin transport system ATPase subunit